MARVLLIDPPLYKHPLWDPIRTSQPLGIWSIGSYLAKQGHEVRLVCAPLQGIQRVETLGTGALQTLDAVLEARMATLVTQSTESVLDRWLDDDTILRVGISDAEIVAEVEAFRPDLVGIAALATCMHESFIATARVIRARFPELPIVAGGQHATAMPEELLRGAAGAIDMLVLGEGELVLSKIVGCLPDLAAARSLAGVAYLDGTEVKKNKRPTWTDLDELALLDPALMAHVPLRPLPVHTYGYRPMKYTDMMFSVGCHRACPYCYSPIMRGKLRQLSGDRIVQQLRALKDAGYDELVLQDDDLLKDREFFKSLLRAFADVGLTWQDNGGMELELLDDDLVSAIIDSGCTAIYIPVNPRQIADRLPTVQARANVHYLRRLRDAGIYTITSGIYGVPNLETPSATFDDLARLRDFHVDVVTRRYVDASLVFPLSALPGTRWFMNVARSPAYDFRADNWIGYSVFVPQIYPRELGPRRLWREILDTHRALNAVQESLPWFSPFPNRLVPSAFRPETEARSHLIELRSTAA